MRNNTSQIDRADAAHPSLPQPREVLDIRQAADYLGVSADSLYRYAAEGVIPGFRLGNRWRFKKSRLDQWMDEQSASPAPQKPRPAKKPVRAAR